MAHYSVVDTERSVTEYSTSHSVVDSGTPSGGLAARLRRFLFTSATVIVLIIVLLALFFTAFVGVRAYIYYRFYERVNDTQHPRVLLADVYPHLKTGDIVLFTAGAHHFVNSLLQPNLFSHAGMVVRFNTADGPRLFLAEAQPARFNATAVWPRGEKPGTSLFALRERIESYPGAVYVMPLSAPLRAAQERAVQLEALRVHRYPSLCNQVLRYMRVSKGTVQSLLNADAPSFVCFEWVGRLLDRAGLREAGRPPFGDMGQVEVCEAVAGLSGRGLTGGYRYRPVSQLVGSINAKSEDVLWWRNCGETEMG